MVRTNGLVSDEITTRRLDLMDAATGFLVAPMFPEVDA